MRWSGNSQVSSARAMPRHHRCLPLHSPICTTSGSPVATKSVKAFPIYRAMETKVWRTSDVSKVAPVEPPFNFEAIQSLVQLCTWEDQAWQDFFRQHAIERCNSDAMWCTRTCWSRLPRWFDGC